MSLLPCHRQKVLYLHPSRCKIPASLFTTPTPSRLYTCSGFGRPRATSEKAGRDYELDRIVAGTRCPITAQGIVLGHHRPPLLPFTPTPHGLQRSRSRIPSSNIHGNGQGCYIYKSVYFYSIPSLQNGRRLTIDAERGSEHRPHPRISGIAVFYLYTYKITKYLC